MSALTEYILATRPWSLTAALIPILTTACVLGAPLFSVRFAQALVMGISIQIGANLTNTYFDYINGVDSKDTECGEKTIVDNKVPALVVLIMSILFYAIGLITIVPILIEHRSAELISIFSIGLFLSIFYTATPVGLKYRALGDLTIFVTFGPLLMQCTSLILTKSLTPGLYLYAIPIGLIIEAILHANNTRDIQADTAAGAVTLASILGFEGSYKFFTGLYIASYVSVIYIGSISHWGCLLALVTIPTAVSIVRSFEERKLKNLCVEVAQMFLPFGLLFIAGIKFTSAGLLSFGF